MADIAVQGSFNSGEWAPALFARVDIQKYRSGAALLENFFVDYRGGASTRAGTRFIYPAPDGQIRLIPFQETSELGYILVFTHLKLQFVSRGAVVTEAAFNITAATQANPAVITATSNNFIAGDLIFITGASGMTELNDRFFLVHSTGGGSTVTLDDFFGNPIDSTAYGAYTTGGTSARIYTIATPYSGSQLVDIKYAQNVSEMVLCHPDQPPYLLTIVTANNWTLNPIVFGSTAAVPGAISLSSSLAVGSVNYAYQVTSVDAGGQESGPSPTGDYLGAVDLRTTGGSIQLSWSAVSGAVSYNVYKADVSYIGAVPPGSTFGFIGFTTGTTFIDSNIAPDFTITPPVPTNPFSGSGLYQTSIITPGTYTTVPTVSVVGTASIVGSVAAVLQVQGTPTVGAGGAGYGVGDTVVFTNSVILRVHSVVAGAVTVWEPITDPFSNGGAVTSGSTPTNPVTQVSTSGGGTGVSANLVWGVGYLVILSPGSGYLTNPTAVFSSGAAVAQLTIAPAFAGNPTVPGFFQQRLVLASQTIAPQTFYMSKPGQFFNFDVSFPTRPDDSITETLVAGVLNTIEALVSSTSGMLILTDHGSWIVNGGSSGSAVSPSAIVANAQSFNGIRTQPAPIVANYDVLYPQQKGSSVRDLSFNIYFNVFTGTDISIMPSHLFFGHQIIDWTWAEEPYKIVWALREDGVMLSCTYMKEQEFVGWAHHITPSGSYKAIAAVTEPDEETGDVFVDAAYVAIERPITPSPPPPPPPGCVAVPLDFIPQPLAAYGLRQLLSSYTANKAIRVYRNPDGAEMDIGFAAPCNYLDITALLAFGASGTSLAVSVWYDQSGNGLDLAPFAGTKSTAPQIVTGGVLSATIGGRPAMLFNSATERLTCTTPVTLGASQNSLFAVGNATAGATSAFLTEGNQGYNLFNAANVSIGANGPYYAIGFGQSGSASAPCMNAWKNTDYFFNGGAFIQTPVTYTFSTDAIWVSRWNTSDSPVSKSYVNGGVPGTDNNNAGTAAGFNTNLGMAIGLVPVGGASYTGLLAEFVVYDSELSVANSNSYGNNAHTFFGISWTNIS